MQNDNFYSEIGFGYKIDCERNKKTGIAAVHSLPGTYMIQMCHAQAMHK